MGFPWELRGHNFRKCQLPLHQENLAFGNLESQTRNGFRALRLVKYSAAMVLEINAPPLRFRPKSEDLCGGSELRCAAVIL